MCGIFDKRGKIWHLNFQPDIAKHFKKRLKAHDLNILETEIPSAWVNLLCEELSAYLDGKICELRYPHFLLATKFEKQVLLIVRKIPYGQVRTYSWLAKKIGRPKGYRAVGRALALNPLPIFFPCHRIVAKHGLGGFSGGLTTKRLLLEIEGYTFCSTQTLSND